MGASAQAEKIISKIPFFEMVPSQRWMQHFTLKATPAIESARDLVPNGKPPLRGIKRIEITMMQFGPLHEMLQLWAGERFFEHIVKNTHGMHQIDNMIWMPYSVSWHF